MQGINKHILNNIGEKLAKKEEISRQEKRKKLEELPNEELNALLEISEIYAEYGSEENMSDTQLKRLEVLFNELDL